MYKRVARLLLIASLFSSMGAHLAIIQTVAWARMAVSFSRSCSFEASLQKTLDGRHPCALCLKVKKASQAGPSLGASPNEYRVDGAYLASLAQIRRINLTWRLAPIITIAQHYIVPPDSPPPKGILS